MYWNKFAMQSDDEDDDYTPPPRRRHHHHHEPQEINRDYVDPWDLENYAYIREHLSDPSSAAEANSTSFYYVPAQLVSKEQNYAAIEEIQPNLTYIKNRNCVKASAHSFDSEDDENSYYDDENPRDAASSFYDSPAKNRRWRNKEQNQSSYNNDYYGPNNPDIYSKLDEIYHRETIKDSILLPIYDDIKSARQKQQQPTNFSLSNYGHLKIDYSYSWNNLDKYICN